MRPQPLYDSAGVHPAFELRYSWAAWPFSPPLLAQPDVLSRGRAVLGERRAPGVGAMLVR